MRINDSSFHIRPLRQSFACIDVDLKKLYPYSSDRTGCIKRIYALLSADPDYEKVIRVRGTILQYETDFLIPTVIDDRPPLLLVFGNSTAHSMAHDTYFAYEKGGKQHRMWRIFHDVGLMRFTPNYFKLSIAQAAQGRTKDFYRLAYHGPYRVAMTCYYSLPTPPTDPPWSGVAGIYKLFGPKAMPAIEAFEWERFQTTLKNFMPQGGTIIVFQKDAYQQMRGSDSPAYTFKTACATGIQGTLRNDPRYTIHALPPTRFMHMFRAREVFRQIISAAVF